MAEKGVVLTRTPTVGSLALADLSGVWAIERTLLGPWTEAQLRGELALAHGWQLVAKAADGEVCGYLFASTVVDEAEIRKLAVAAAYRQQGIGHLLLSTACQQLSRQSIARCFLELRASNRAALTLYQKNHFQIVGQRKSYYTAPTEDAMVLQLSFNHNRERPDETDRRA